MPRYDMPPPHFIQAAMTIGQFDNGIRQHFGADPNKFLWRDGLLMFGKIMIDLMYLDDWLMQQPSYDPDASIRDNVAKMYGEDAARWVESAM